MALSEKEYNEIGSAKQLKLIGFAPINVYTSTLWKCLLCGREHDKTYRAVKYGRHGCICQSTRVNQRIRYEVLGRSLGIRFVGTTDGDSGGTVSATDNRGFESSESSICDGQSWRILCTGGETRTCDDNSCNCRGRKDSAQTTALEYTGTYNSGGVPRTTKELVVWSRTEDDSQLFLASFQQLSYGNGKKLKKILGISNE